MLEQKALLAGLRGAGESNCATAEVGRVNHFQITEWHAAESNEKATGCTSFGAMVIGYAELPIGCGGEICRPASY